MSYDIYTHNLKDDESPTTLIKCADIVTCELDTEEQLINIMYRRGLRIDCIAVTSFKCVECGAPEFYPMRSPKHQKSNNAPSAKKPLHSKPLSQRSPNILYKIFGGTTKRNKKQ